MRLLAPLVVRLFAWLRLCVCEFVWLVVGMSVRLVVCVCLFALVVYLLVCLCVCVLGFCLIACPP